MSDDQRCVISSDHLENVDSQLGIQIDYRQKSLDKRQWILASMKFSHFHSTDTVLLFPQDSIGQPQ